MAGRHPDTDFRIEFFASPVADPSGFGEGQTFLGATLIRTDGGNAGFNVTLSVSVPLGQSITATATKVVTIFQDTSEFSAAIRLLGPLVYDIPGGDGTDNIALRLSSGILEIVDLNTSGVVASQALDLTSEVIINGVDNEIDIFTLDFGFGGLFTLPDGITFDGGTGAGDRIVAVGANADHALTTSDATTGNHSLSIDGGPDMTLLGVEEASLLAGPGNNRLDASGFTGRTTLNGGGANDTVLGGFGPDRLDGSFGNEARTATLLPRGTRADAAGTVLIPAHG